MSQSARQKPGNADVVIWLTPLSENPPAVQPKHARLAQHNKRFEPHLLVVPVGSAVDFPNEDPFFHNVFSLYKGKRFDLGLYEAGTSRTVRFDQPGAAFIFCNIHPQMSAVVLAVPTSYYGISNNAGELTIPDVPPGRYRLEVWYEYSSGADLSKDSRVITFPDTAEVSMTVQRTIEGPIPHKNKYGEDYGPSSDTYPQ